MRTVLTALIIIPMLACGGTIVAPDPHLWVTEVPADEFPEGAWMGPGHGRGSFPPRSASATPMKSRSTGSSGGITSTRIRSTTSPAWVTATN